MPLQFHILKVDMNCWYLKYIYVIFLSSFWVQTLAFSMIFYLFVYIRIYNEWIVRNQETNKWIKSKKILTCYLKEIIITFLHLQQVYVFQERKNNIKKYEKFLGQYFIAWNLRKKSDRIGIGSPWKNSRRG